MSKFCKNQAKEQEKGKEEGESWSKEEPVSKGECSQLQTLSQSLGKIADFIEKRSKFEVTILSLLLQPAPNSNLPNFEPQKTQF